MNDYRRTLQEVSARYILEPQLKDIYVEGRYDQNFVTWVLACSELEEVVVYEINSVEITTAEFTAIGCSGNKSRVIALSNHLADDAGISDTQVACIVDKDFDTALNNLTQNRFLLYTDFSCMDMYCSSDITLRKYLERSMAVNPVDTTSILRVMENALIENALIRAANGTLGWCLTTFTCDRGLSISGSDVEFNRDAQIDRCLQSQGKIKDRVIFMTEIERLRSIFSGNFRDYSNGHDLLGFLAAIARGVCGRSKIDDRIVSDSLTMAITCDEMLSRDLFQSLVSRFSTALDSP